MNGLCLVIFGSSGGVGDLRREWEGVIIVYGGGGGAMSRSPQM